LFLGPPPPPPPPSLARSLSLSLSLRRTLVRQAMYEEGQSLFLLTTCTTRGTLYVRICISVYTHTHTHSHTHGVESAGGGAVPMLHPPPSLLLPLLPFLLPSPSCVLSRSRSRSLSLSLSVPMLQLLTTSDPSGVIATLPPPPATDRGQLYPASRKESFPLHGTRSACTLLRVPFKANQVRAETG